MPNRRTTVAHFACSITNTALNAARVFAVTSVPCASTAMRSVGSVGAFTSAA